MLFTQIRRERKPQDQTTDIESVRRIALYYTADDGRNISLHEGILQSNRQTSRFDLRYKGKHLSLPLASFTLEKNIDDLHRGKDIYAYLCDDDGLDGQVILFTLFGNADVANRWISERRKEYQRGLMAP